MDYSDSIYKDITFESSNAIHFDELHHLDVLHYNNYIINNYFNKYIWIILIIIIIILLIERHFQQAVSGALQHSKE